MAVGTPLADARYVEVSSAFSMTVWLECGADGWARVWLVSLSKTDEPKGYREGQGVAMDSPLMV